METTSTQNNVLYGTLMLGLLSCGAADEPAATQQDHGIGAAAVHWGYDGDDHGHRGQQSYDLGRQR